MTTRITRKGIGHGQDSSRKSQKLSLDKQTLKDLAPRKGQDAVRGGGSSRPTVPQ